MADHPGCSREALLRQNIAIPANAPGSWVVLAEDWLVALDDQDALSMVQHAADNGAFRDVGLHLFDIVLEAAGSVNLVPVARSVKAVGLDDPGLNLRISKGQSVVGVVAPLGVAGDIDPVIWVSLADLVKILSGQPMSGNFRCIIHDHVLAPADHGLVGAPVGDQDGPIVQAEGASVELDGFRLNLHLVDPVQNGQVSQTGRLGQEQEFSFVQILPAVRLTLVDGLADLA